MTNFIIQWKQDQAIVTARKLSLTFFASIFDCCSRPTLATTAHEIHLQSPSLIKPVPQASLAAPARHAHRPRHGTLFLSAATQSLFWRAECLALKSLQLGYPHRPRPQHLPSPSFAKAWSIAKSYDPASRSDATFVEGTLYLLHLQSVQGRDPHLAIC
ncbi:hypothetical protein IG631_00151 [Alternaria alternata]|nr:hypothetical protein IG631_00151 [Alternaria alternata]